MCMYQFQKEGVKRFVDVLSITVLLALLNPVLAQAVGSPLSPQNQGSEWEEWHDPIPVSGEIRVGVMAGSDQTISGEQKSFYIKVPQDFSNNVLCVSISSIDGRYTASMQYNATHLIPGAINELKWASRYVTDLAEIKDERIAILVGTGEECKDRPKEFLVAAWDYKSFEEDEIYFYANSSVNPKLLITKDDKSIVKNNFIEVTHDKTVAYKVESKLGVSTLESVKTISLSQRVKKGPGFTYKTYPFDIRF